MKTENLDFDSENNKFIKKNESNTLHQSANFLKKYSAQRKYYQKHKKKLLQYHNKYVSERRKTDPEFRSKLSLNAYISRLKSREPKCGFTNIVGQTHLNKTIKDRRERAEETLQYIPSNVVTIQDMIKYYIYGDKK